MKTARGSRIGKERLGVLNAYFPSRGGKQALPDQITLVNTFRFVENYYLDKKLPLLPERSYFSGYKTSYFFEDVTALFVGSEL